MDLRVGRLPKVRVLQKPEESLRSLVERAPQAEAWTDAFLEKLRPTLNWLYNNRRRLATAVLAISTTWLFVHVMFGANGMVVYRSKKTEAESLQKEIDSLQKENGRYTDQIKALKTDPRAIEKEAREQLHYARPGEVIYVAPTPPAPPARVTGAARK